MTRRPELPLPTASRRRFLKTTGAGVLATCSAPGFARSAESAGELRFAVIGCGSRGSDHIRDLVGRSRSPGGGVRVVAVCDIYRPRLEKAVERSQADGVHDYRAVLERKDVDCVVIATPDHWHARMCIDALDAGKDVYCEKPWTRTASEAKECYRKVRATGRICQIGTQRTANGAYWAAREAIGAGKIGKVVWSQTSYSRNSRAGEWNYPLDPAASPENLDWEAFLGPAPKRPFDPERFFRFRKYWDYSGGIATDLHYHRLAPLLIALGAGFPWRVTSGGGIWVHKDADHRSPREVPDTFMSIFDFAEEHTIVIASSMATSHGLPDVIRGHEARIEFAGDEIELIPEPPYRGDFKSRSGGQETVRLRGKPRDDHMTNFIRCVRSRRAEDLNCGPALGYKTMVAIALSVDAYRKGKVLYWDPRREEVVEDDPLAAGG